MLASIQENRQFDDIDPLLVPLRLLLHTRDDRLLDLPWWNLSRNGTALVQFPDRPGEQSAGWTVEFLAAAHPDARLKDHVLHAPCPVMLIAPRAPGTGHAGRDLLPLALGEPLERLWPEHAEQPQVASTWAQAEAMLRTQKPGIVEVLGTVRRGDGGGELLWECSDGKVAYRPLADLAKLWDSRPPEVLLLNLIGLEHVGAACVTVVREVPLTLLQCGPTERAAQIRRGAIEFLQALLSSAGPVVPGRLAARHAHRYART